MAWICGILLVACIVALVAWALCRASANRDKAWDEVVG